jgi:hypothetical protein
MSNLLLNGLDGIIRNDDSSVKHVIHSILFFQKNIVEQQALGVMQNIKQGEAIPVRYTSNQHFYHQREKNKVTPSFKSKKEALRFTSEHLLFHKDTEIPICFDSDGNYTTKKDVSKYTHHSMSGKKRTIINYTISHIWGKTDNPLYFSLMWNYCLIPTSYAFLTDKSDDISNRVKNLIKAISIELYNPELLMEQRITFASLPQETFKNEAKQLIQNDKIQFVPINNLVTK